MDRIALHHPKLRLKLEHAGTSQVANKEWYHECNALPKSLSSMPRLTSETDSGLSSYASSDAEERYSIYESSHTHKEQTRTVLTTPLSPLKLSLPSFPSIKLKLKRKYENEMELTRPGSSKRIRLIVKHSSSSSSHSSPGKMLEGDRIGFSRGFPQNKNIVVPFKKRKHPVHIAPNAPIKFRVISKSLMSDKATSLSIVDHMSKKDSKISTTTVSTEFSETQSTRDKVLDYLEWALRPQSELSLHYDVQGILGWGGCGFVLQAIRKQDDTEVAVKVIYREKISLSPRGIPPEIEIMKSLNHPHLTNYLAHFSDVRAFYVVMERHGTPWRSSDLVVKAMNDWLNKRLTMGNASLSKIVIRNSHSVNSSGPNASSSLYDYISEFGVVSSHLLPQFFVQVASGLSYLHDQSIFHGDVKEENTLVELDAKTGQYRLFLCDFGHSRHSREGERLLRSYGTREISAPELIPNLLQRPYRTLSTSQCGTDDLFDGFAQDVWALGLVLYTMIFGSLPPETDELLDGTLDLSHAPYLPTDYSSKRIDPDCILLLQSMLSIYPANRPTMQQVLNHPWCSQGKV